MELTNRFIVVDDDPLNNLVCRHIVQKFNKDAQIILFTNPEEALKSIEETFNDRVEDGGTVMFLDINMPAMSGWEFLEIFETFGENIHKQFSIYVLSSSIDEGDIEKADKNPFVEGYYSKPLSIQTMKSIHDKHSLSFHAKN